MKKATYREAQLMPDPEIIGLGDLVVPEKATIDDMVDEMVRAGGYDGYQPGLDDVCQNFSITRYGSRKLYLAHFKQDEHYMDDEELSRAIVAMGDKEDALIEDLLAVGAHPKHKELQLKFVIVARGSSYLLGANRYIPSLYGFRDDGFRDKRALYMCHVSPWSSWLSHYRFLLVQSSHKATTDKSVSPG